MGSHLTCAACGARWEAGAVGAHVLKSPWFQEFIWKRFGPNNSQGERSYTERDIAAWHAEHGCRLWPNLTPEGVDLAAFSASTEQWLPAGSPSESDVFVIDAVFGAWRGVWKGAPVCPACGGGLE